MRAVSHTRDACGVGKVGAVGVIDDGLTGDWQGVAVEISISIGAVAAVDFDCVYFDVILIDRQRASTRVCPEPRRIWIFPRKREIPSLGYDHGTVCDIGSPFEKATAISRVVEKVGIAATCGGGKVRAKVAALASRVVIVEHEEQDHAVTVAH